MQVVENRYRDSRDPTPIYKSKGGGSRRRVSVEEEKELLGLLSAFLFLAVVTMLWFLRRQDVWTLLIFVFSLSGTVYYWVRNEHGVHGRSMDSLGWIGKVCERFPGIVGN